MLEVGRIAVGADPAGRGLRPVAGEEHTGTDLVDEPGALCWAESMSRDYDASKGSTPTSSATGCQEIGEGGFRYSVANLDGELAVGGIGAIPAQAPADVPSHWMVYFAVADCDAAVRRSSSSAARSCRALRQPLRAAGARRRPTGRDLLGQRPVRASAR